MIKSETHVVGKKSRGGPRRHLEHVPGQMIMRIRDRAVQPHLAASGLKLTAPEARRLPASVKPPPRL